MCGIRSRRASRRARVGHIDTSENLFESERRVPRFSPLRFSVRHATGIGVESIVEEDPGAGSRVRRRTLMELRQEGVCVLGVPCVHLELHGPERRIKGGRQASKARTISQPLPLRMATNSLGFQDHSGDYDRRRVCRAEYGDKITGGI